MERSDIPVFIGKANGAKGEICQLSKSWQIFVRNPLKISDNFHGSFLFDVARSVSPLLLPP